MDKVSKEELDNLIYHTIKAEHMRLRVEAARQGHKFAKRYHRMTIWFPRLWLGIALFNGGVAIHAIATPPTSPLTILNVAVGLYCMYYWSKRKALLADAQEKHQFWHDELHSLRAEAINAAYELMETSGFDKDDLPPEIVAGLEQKYLEQKYAELQVEATKEDFRN